MLLRNKWGSLFSSEPEIIKLVANVLPLVAAFQLSDGLSGAMGGVLRGAGKPVLGAIVRARALFLPPFSLHGPHGRCSDTEAYRSILRVTMSSDCLSVSRSPLSDPNSA